MRLGLVENQLSRKLFQMQKLLSDPKYSQFNLVGSGIQWKIDRITLGIQTVNRDVSPELSMRYQDEIRERMHRVDPNEEVWILYKTTLRNESL